MRSFPFSLSLSLLCFQELLDNYNTFGRTTPEWLFDLVSDVEGVSEDYIEPLADSENEQKNEIEIFSNSASALSLHNDDLR
jgi:hypothetical protein